jgi:RNA polymerase sigma factor (sigma-70 family)
MGDPIDDNLLIRWHEGRDGEAFGELVRRHADLVYGIATRQLASGDRHLIDDVIQAVFLVLLQKAGTARGASSLAAWLHQTTRYAVANARRVAARRARHERAAAELRSEVAMPLPSAPAHELMPLLDDAIASLGTKDRTVIVERFLKGGTVAHVAVQMGTSPEAAQKRIERAADKLRHFFAGHGVKTMGSGAITTAAIMAVIESTTASTSAVSPRAFGAHSIPHAGASVSVEVTSIAKGTIAMMNWKRIRPVGLVTAAVLLLSVAGLQIARVAEAQTPTVAPGVAGATKTPGEPGTAGARQVPNAPPAPTQMATAPATLPSPSFDVDPARNVFKPGTFEDELTATSYVTAGWQSADVPAGGRLEVLDNETCYARLSASAADAPVTVSHTLPLDPSWKWITVSARLRSPGVKVDNKTDGPTVTFSLLDKDAADAKARRVPIVLQPLLSGPYRDWNRPSGVIEIQPGEAVLRIAATTNHARGEFDVDNVMVVPFDPKDVLDPAKVDAIQAAVRAGDAEAVKRLVKEDPRLLEARDRSYDGGTPLIITCYEGKDEIARLLLDLGAQIDAIDRNYKAPAICWAGYFGWPKIVQVLLDAGANPFSKNGTGTTALECAKFGLNKRKFGDATDDQRRQAIELLQDAEDNTGP